VPNVSIREKYTDRLIQAQRMGALSDMLNAQGYDTIADFVCPTKKTRKQFGKAFIVWVDRIEQSRFEDTNKVFVAPEQYDIRVTEQDAGRWAKIIYEQISHKI
jgi:adenylylsulfate kinase